VPAIARARTDVAVATRNATARTHVGAAIASARTHVGVALTVAIAFTHVGRARAERPVHGSIGAGGPLLLTAHDDNRLRAELELDVEPGSRYGGLVAWRGFDEKAHGMLLGGLLYEAGAARPLLVVDLHADVGADLDQYAPVIGGGVRTVLTIWGPLGVALDGGAYLVIDGVDDTRLRIMGSTSIVVRW
jgi:hypothetical protein